MFQKKRQISWFLKCILLFLFLSVQADSKVSFRTSSADSKSVNDDNKVFVAIDFEVLPGEHVTAPVGKGKSLAPNMAWKNAKVLGVMWPKAIDLPGSSGAPSEYSGYDKNFTLIYSLSIEDKSKPVEYDLFYVSCSDSCKPIQEAGELSLNGLLPKDEIENAEKAGKKDSGHSFGFILLLAMLGGIILNCMPCVFPIVSMKVFGIIKSSQSNASDIKKHSLILSAGMISTFLALGSILLFLRQSIADLGWGFYMQEPRFVAVLLLSFLLCALNFFGLYQLKLPSIRTSSLQNISVYAKSFFSGVFGAFVSAACVGPFAGIAIASALLYGSALESGCIFAALGIGVAFPFLIIAFFPSALKIFPKPGEWMEKFKEFMGFAMLFSCVWLLWILSEQIGMQGVMQILLTVIALSMFIWMFGKTKKSKVFMAFSVLGIFASGYSSIYLAKNEENSIGIKWSGYSEEIFNNLKSQKKPIFLNFTASWCLNCQFNQRVFSDKEVFEAFEKGSVAPLKCDWTNRNTEITKLLEKFGATSVPFYVLYLPEKDETVILPTMLTKKSILEALRL